MARGKYQQWLENAQLERITNWAANGCTYAELAQNMGISERTLYAWLDQHPQISQAVKNGREMCVQHVENAFFRRAMGLCEAVTETADEEQREVDGEMVTVFRKVRTTVRKLPPDTAALIFYLKNKAGYRSEPEVEVNVEAMPRFYFDRAELEQD